VPQRVPRAGGALQRAAGAVHADERHRQSAPDAAGPRASERRRRARDRRARLAVPEGRASGHHRRRLGAPDALASRIVRSRAIVLFAILLAWPAASFQAAAPIIYRFTFPEPQHRWMQVEAAFAGLGGAPLELRMSRSSPGRYSLHDFAKNVYDVHAFGADGREIALTRPDPYGWNAANHGGAVRVTYKIYGDRVDGTYLAVDETHAHINMPAAIMWAHGLEDRPAVLTFD